jgi:hypothetical protein
MLVTSPEGAQSDNTKTAAEIVNVIRSELGGNGEILGARRLPSGAFALTFRTPEAKKLWREQGKIEAVFGASARVQESTLDVIVFGCPPGKISTLTAQERINAISKQNPNLGNNLKRVGVLKGSPAKRFEAVILGFDEASAANAATEAGIIWGASVLNAEPFLKEIRSQHYFKCQSYSNHNAKFCRNATRCGWCAQLGHSISECTVSHNISLKACTPCGGQRGHCALDAHCPAQLRDNE